MKKIILSILVLTAIISAQQTGRLRGFVTDSTSGEYLPYANVYINELHTGASTNERGLYIINQIPANETYTVSISFIGYKTKTVDVRIVPNKITELNIAISPSGVEFSEIEKIGEKIFEKNQTDIGLERISVKRLQSLPKGVETDVFRSLQYVAGVQSTGDVSAKYYVRGGTSDQNLVQLNGITIYNPFHALGLFSVIDPEMINSVEFYKGGFTAEYGSRISSVLSIVSKDGNRKRYSATSSTSFLTSKVLLEGPSPGGSFMVTGRKSYSDFVLKKFLNNQNIPIDFYDASFKLNFADDNVVKNGRFHLFGFISGDNLDYEDPFKENYEWSNNLLGFAWIQVYDIPLYSRLGVSASTFEGKVVPNQTEAKPLHNKVTDISLSMDFNYVMSNKDEIEAGIVFKTIKTQLSLVNQQGAKTETDDFSGNISIYAKYKMLRYEDFGVDVGARLNGSGLTSKGGLYLEPRLSVTYRLFPFLSLKGSVGRYQQEVATIADETQIISLFEPWTIIPDYLEPTRAVQYSAGFDFYITNDFILSYEGYYKDIKNLTAINENKSFDYEPDLVNGNGEAYGSEISIKYVTPRINANLAYSLSWAYKEVEGWLYYPKYDTKHWLTIGFEYNFGAGWSANTVWSFRSGLPYTPISGAYDKLYPGNFFQPDPSQYDYEPYTVLGDKNTERLPVYHRLDITLTKKFEIAFISGEISASIINVYDRENIFYFKRDTGERVNMLPFLPTATLKVKL